MGRNSGIENGIENGIGNEIENRAGNGIKNRAESGIKGEVKAITTHNLTKYYGAFPKQYHDRKQDHEKRSGAIRGIEGVNLSVEEGDFFGFIGPNGAGKSTTIRILLGLISATDGQAEIFGQDVRQDRTVLLAQIGYLPSEPFMYHGMRVRDVLRLSAKLRRKDCSAEAEVLCRRLELDVSRRVDELSLGNRKKVGIVCAMQHRPRLYILDEPTSGLDPLMQREFYALLKERNEEGATVFLSSHILPEVQRYCRHAAVIREGRLLVCDSVEKLGHAEAKRVTFRCEGNAPAREQAERLQMLLGQNGRPGQNELPGQNGRLGQNERPGQNEFSGQNDASAEMAGTIKDLEAAGDTVSFLYSGEQGLLLKALSGLPLADITIAEPDLEEIFLHFYAEGEKKYEGEGGSGR